jgi:hypothetical protein
VEYQRICTPTLSGGEKLPNTTDVFAIQHSISHSVPQDREQTMANEASPSVPTPVPHRLVVKAFEAALDAAITRIDRYYTPMIELEEKRTQNFTTLAAGAIVASLTVFQALGTDKLEGKIWLALTWGAFILVIVLCLATAYDLANLRTFGSRLMSRRQQSIAELLPHSSTDLLEDTVDLKVSELVDRVAEELKTHTDDYAKQLRAAGRAFLLGLCFFVLFGLVNLF